MAKARAKSRSEPRSKSHQRLYLVAVRGNLGMINARGEIVIDPRLNYFLEPWSDGRVAFQTSLLKPYGYLDSAGRVVIEPRFDEAQEFHEGLAAVRVKGKWGYIDAGGEMVIPPQFSRAGHFSEGLAPAAAGTTRRGYIDRTGKWAVVLPPGATVPELASYSLDLTDGFAEGRGVFRLGRRYGFVDAAGRVAVPPEYTWAGTFNEGMACVRRGRRVLFIDHDGGVALEPPFEPESNFREGLTGFAAKQWKRTEGTREASGPYGFFDRRGRVVIDPVYEAVGSFYEGLAAVRLRGKWGYVDRKGRLAIEPRWDDAYGFEGGVAGVESGDRTGYIDRRGEYVWKPTR